MSLPLLLQPADLHAALGTPGLLVVDLGKASVYLQAHVPGAVHCHGRDLLPAMLAVPMWLLFDAGLFFGRLMEKDKTASS